MDLSPVVPNYAVLGALLFVLGAVGFIARRNLIVLFLCAELMLQGVSLTVIGFNKLHGTWSGQVLTVFSLAIAAAEAAIALALIVVLFRRYESLDVSLWQDLREPEQPPTIDPVPPESTDEIDQIQWPHLHPAGRLPANRKPKQEVPVSSSS
jgi:NADH-quinone oxidoreductase subunit K